MQIPCKICILRAMCINKHSLHCKHLTRFLEPIDTDSFVMTDESYQQRLRQLERVFDRGLIAMEQKSGYVSLTSYSLTKYYKSIKKSEEKHQYYHKHSLPYNWK